MSSSRRPNVLVIMADDLGFGDLGRYSYGAVATPNLDFLAESGVTLDQHYSASPICAPARAAFLTGRYPQRSGAIDTFPHRGLDAIALRERTIGDTFSDAGYATGLIGKWHNGAIGAEYHPNRRGFAEFIGFRGGVQEYWDWRLERNGDPYLADGRYLTDVLTDETVDFVRRHAGDEWFLLLAYTAPHGPFQAPQDDVDRVRRRRGASPALVDVIAAMVEVMDRGIGLILAELERLGIAEDTIVLFTSDNGPWMRPGGADESTVRYNLGLAGGKELVLEGGIRVPALLRAPGVTGGVISHEFMHFTDWLPTLCDLAGVEARSLLPGDGLDMAGMLRGDRPDLAAKRFWQWSRYEPIGIVNAAIRDGPWKLVYPPTERSLLILHSDQVEERKLRRDPYGYRPPPGGFETPPPISGEGHLPRLYDLARDPGETNDLSSAHPDRVASMNERLQSLFDEVETERARSTGDALDAGA